MADKINVDALYNEFAPSGKKTISPAGLDVDALYTEFSRPRSTDVIVTRPELPQENISKRFVAGGKKGAEDVINTVGQGIGYIDETVTEGGAKRRMSFGERVKAENKKYEEKYGSDPVAQAGRITGQIATSAPLVPGRLLQATDVALGAAPVITASGMKVSAPIINRTLSSSVKGAEGGGLFALTTQAGSEKPLGENVQEGIITGAIGGPVVMMGSATAGKVVNSLQDLWAAVNVNRLAASSGLPASSVKKVIKHLEDAGLTPQQADAELKALGPKATLMDLDASLATTGSGLASFGGKPTSILKGRMAARGETANDDIVRQVQRRLGARPNLDVEKENVVKSARAATSQDYAAAHADTTKLPTNGLIQHIDTLLEDAVGQKATALKEIKGFFYNTKGNLKDSVKSLHEVRQGIDDIINRKGDSLPGNAKRAVTGVRDLVDTILKTNPQMAAADAKFAKLMEVRDALDYGFNVIKKGANRDDFTKIFNAGSSEQQEAIKKGMLAAIGNVLDENAQGQLSGAARLFEKKAVNRANFRTAFGNNADDVLDDIHRELSFRNTERGIQFGSQTAERQAVQQEYGLRPKPPGAISEGVKASAFDMISGLPLVAATTHGVHTGIKNRFAKFSENRLAQLVEGSADILSRSGAERDVALGIATRIKAIQDKTAQSKAKSVIRLPVTAAPVAGEDAQDVAGYTAKTIKNTFHKVFGQ